jgi:hypothetical protein
MPRGKKKRQKSIQEEEEVPLAIEPELPEEPPELSEVCDNCMKKTSRLQSYVRIERKGWFPPHMFGTFCTKRCASEWWKDPTGRKVKITTYKKWKEK